MFVCTQLFTSSWFVVRVYNFRAICRMSINASSTTSLSVYHAGYPIGVHSKVVPMLTCALYIYGI